MTENKKGMNPNLMVDAWKAVRHMKIRTVRYV